MPARLLTSGANYRATPTLGGSDIDPGVPACHAHGFRGPNALDEKHCPIIAPVSLLVLQGIKWSVGRRLNSEPPWARGFKQSMQRR